MQDAEIDEAAISATIRRLRALIGVDVSEDEATARGWRDDLRLFAVTWAAGFLFFLILLA